MTHHDPDRRRFVSGAVLAAGYALATRPAAAGAIATDAKGLHAGTVMIPTTTGEMPGYAAMPAGKGPHPAVLVVQEIFGVHEYIRDICRRLAKLGYLAVAPELYFRQGDPSTIPDIPTLLSTLVSKVPDAQVLADLDASARWAEANGADPARMGITGYCWGGRIAWLYAAHNPRLKAAVAWYGRLVGEATPNTPRHPIDVAAGLSVPVLGLYGGADTGIPLDTVERMKQGLKAGTSGSDIVVYPDAPHAFHADYRPSYREAPAKDGWVRLQSWFASHGLV
ncbi:MAG: dienelactone hydrolase family protein [Actinomycetota bacterium]